MRLIRAALAAALVTAPLAAMANEYEVFIDIENEEDLYELQAQELIEEDTFESLLEILQRGVDINSATRDELYTLPNLTYTEVDAILDYRDETGAIVDPAVLVASGILSEEKFLAIAPFLVFRARDGKLNLDGLMRYQIAYSPEDTGAPPMALQARFRAFDHLAVGAVGVLTRNRIGDPIADPNRGALTAENQNNRLNVPKIYAFYDTDEFAIIAGSYRIGFGQRLTFDTTSQYTPNGIYRDDEIRRDTSLTRECRESAGELGTSPCAGPAGDIYITPDFKWSERQLGVAGGLKDINIGDGHLQLYAFASHNSRDIYQYQLYNPSICDDPHNDDDACGAPDVFVTREDPFEPTSEISYMTLPNMYTETIGGGNATYWINRRSRVGITGYGADVTFLTDGIDLDFQEWARTPYGGPFGAVGVDASYGYKHIDVSAELTRSFDSMVDEGNGGFGGIVRAVFTKDKQEVEASGRFYDKTFANPYSRSIAAADTYDGLRGRDEAGARLRYTATFDKRWHLRARADVWTSLSDDAIKALLYLRSDWDLNEMLRVGGWLQYQNKDFAESGRTQCFEGSLPDDEVTGAPVQCAGQKSLGALQARWKPDRRFFLTAQYQHEILDDSRYDTRFRQDSAMSLLMTGKPTDDVRIRGRVRYSIDDIPSDKGLCPKLAFTCSTDTDEQNVWLYTDFTYRLRQRDRLRLRYDFFYWLDNRGSTIGDPMDPLDNGRRPNPEHWLWLEYQATF